MASAGLAAVVDRNVRQGHVARIAARAGVPLGPPAVWLLMRLDERDGETLDALAQRSPYDAPALRGAAEELRAGGYIVDRAGDGAHGWQLTSAGCDTLGRIVAARRAHIEEVFGQWTAEERGDLAALLRRVTRELVPDVRSTGEHPVAQPTDVGATRGQTSQST
jgi:DNA-binding MarR family transcriptional regulator